MLYRGDFLHNACHMMDGGLGLVWNVIGSDWTLCLGLELELRCLYSTAFTIICFHPLTSFAKKIC